VTSIIELGAALVGMAVLVAVVTGMVGA